MDNEKLIELVKGYPFLYDPSDKKYWDNSHKDAAWREISTKLKVTDRDCKRCWALLRDGFRRAMKREKQAQNDQRKLPNRKWRYLEEMSFLLAYKIEKPYSNNESKPDHYDDCEKNSENEEISSFDHAPNELSSDNLSIRTYPTPEQNPNNRKRKILRQRPTRRGSASASLMKYILERKEAMDDTEQFFTSIATTVRTFPLRERAIAKARVFEVISAMEIELLSGPPTSVCSTPDQKPFSKFDSSNEILSE